MLVQDVWRRIQSDPGNGVFSPPPEASTSTYAVETSLGLTTWAEQRYRQTGGAHSTETWSEAEASEIVDPMYLFARFLEWEKHNEPSAAWDLLSAAQSIHSETRAHALQLLASSAHFASTFETPRMARCRWGSSSFFSEDSDLDLPYGLKTSENCTECACRHEGSFCAFSEPVLRSMEEVSQRSTFPAGAILFVEGQKARGMYLLCSGKVRLTKSSREGKMLILKTARPGEALGLSAAISGENYEVTAEAATPCQVNFVERKRFARMLELHSEVGRRTSQSLSRDFQEAYRDIDELMLSRSSAGKLARLLLAHAPGIPNLNESRMRVPMTHEEMAQRIGTSRETVTRLLSELRRKEVIRLDGSTLVVRDRSALEAMAV